MSESVSAAIEAAVVASLEELVVEYGHGSRREVQGGEPPSSRDPDGMAAVICFRSLLFSGSIAIHANADALLALTPTGISADGRDWIAELANQLLGRTKNKMLRLGVPFWAKPATASVATYAEAIGSQPERWFRVTTERGPVHVLLQSNCPDELLAREGEAAETLTEGECLMF